MTPKNDKLMPEVLAQKFHEAYERLAPSFGYETRKESAKPWSDVPEHNKKLMVAVCAEIRADIAAQGEDEVNEYRDVKALEDIDVLLQVVSKIVVDGRYDYNGDPQYLSLKVSEAIKAHKKLCASIPLPAPPVIGEKDDV